MYFAKFTGIIKLGLRLLGVEPACQRGAYIAYMYSEVRGKLLKTNDGIAS